jgi:hypothetical protein
VWNRRCAVSHIIFGTYNGRSDTASAVLAQEVETMALTKGMPAPTVGWLLASAFAGALLAAPQISVDEPNYDAGTIVEGEKKKVTHVFTVKNTGDSDLVIKKVRAG